VQEPHGTSRGANTKCHPLYIHIGSPPGYLRANLGLEERDEKISVAITPSSILVSSPSSHISCELLQDACIYADYSTSPSLQGHPSNPSRNQVIAPPAELRGTCSPLIRVLLSSPHAHCILPTACLRNSIDIDREGSLA
jgi:hypothetical protein